jgi:hypothetical protein
MIVIVVSPKEEVNKELIVSDLARAASSNSMNTCLVRVTNTGTVAPELDGIDVLDLAPDDSDLFSIVSDLDVINDIVIVDSPPLDTEQGELIARVISNQSDSWLCCVIGDLDEHFSGSLRKLRPSGGFEGSNRQVVIASRATSLNHWPKDNNVWIAGVVLEDDLFQSHARMNSVNTVLRLVTGRTAKTVKT